MFCPRKSALVIAHPGHELRVYHWAEIAHPYVFILTDGSGRCKESRLPYTTRLLAQTDACSGRIYGRLTDSEAYHLILHRDFGPFFLLIEEMVDSFIEIEVEDVVGDAVEGYNPAHDVCRLRVSAAVEILRRREEFDDKPAGPYPCALYVGVGRSATTRPRHMIEAHPDLCIPPETGVYPRACWSDSRIQ
jgi:hypothetical protein